MNTRKLNLIYGSLLHDIGKIIYRSNSNEFSKEKHSKLGKNYIAKFERLNKKEILDCISFHHFFELNHTNLDDSNLAYITYIADNIASGVDRRDDISIESETSMSFSKNTPLHSIFNIIYEKEKGNTSSTYNFSLENKHIYPSNSNVDYTSGNYNELVLEMNQILEKLVYVDERYIHSLLQMTESLWRTIPSSTNLNQLIDVSLYDHSKVTAALASCIYDYLEENNISNYKENLFLKNASKDFYEVEAFNLLSMDLSGIQSFIYNISGEQALKSLRARSFYLEIMLEFIADELLEKLQLSRANLLYTGGGHTYFIVPNTEKVKQVINEFENDLKDWLIDNFGMDITISIALQQCSGNDLMNTHGNYHKIWQGISKKLSERKAQKFRHKDILKLQSTVTSGTRECKECLRSDLELSSEDRCPSCESLINLSIKLRRLTDDDYIVVESNGIAKLPFGKSLTIMKKKDIEESNLDRKSVRIYSRNNPNIGAGVDENLWMCDYDYSVLDDATRDKGISSYNDRDKGIRRLGVLRADIDDLGKAFISGFSREYNSISRTTTLSTQLSMFFKFEVKRLIRGKRITVIYSGGDDLFFIGAWDDITNAAVSIRQHFKSFTQNKLTLSAGIGLFPDKFPVSRMADMAGELEEYAKGGTKDQVVLWNKDYLFKWDDFVEKVIKEKLEFISNEMSELQTKGNSFIYKMHDYLNSNEEDININIARFAYLLGKTELTSESSFKLFKWSKEIESRKQLLFALKYYLYSERRDSVNE